MSKAYSQKINIALNSKIKNTEMHILNIDKKVYRTILAAIFYFYEQLNRNYYEQKNC